MRITFVQPPNSSIYSNYKGFDRKAIKRIPLNLASLAAYVRDRGYEVRAIDGDLYNLSIDETAQKVVVTEPNVVAITTTTAIAPIALGIAAKIKEKNPQIKTILGGPHVSALPELVLQSKGVDFVIIGEGEETLAETMKSLEKNENDFSQILGLGYKTKTGEIRINERRPLIKDLDSLPFPAWDIFEYNKYYDFFIHGDKPYFVVTASRGCPFDCTFCGSKTTWGRGIRSHSPEYVLKLLKQITDLGIHNITFVDDTFTLNKENIKTICNGIINHNLNLTFLCSSRVDTIDEERLKILKKAGCKIISFGIESADEQILKNIRKRTNVEKARKAIALTQEYGIETHVCYILGCPGDTKETVEKTIRFAIDTEPDYVQFSLFTPLPGTDAWDQYKDDSNFNLDFSKFRFYGSTVAPNSELTSEYLIKRQKEAYDEFNKRKECKKLK